MPHCRHQTRRCPYTSVTGCDAHGTSVPRAITRRSHTARAATAPTTSVAPSTAALDSDRQPAVDRVAVTLRRHHPKPRQPQNPRTIAPRSHRSSLVVCTSREDDTGWSGARGIALMTRPPSRPPTHQRSAQAAGYSAQTAVLKSTKSQKVSLVSWSRGGPRAGVYAARHPEKVDKLLLYSPAMYNRTGPSSPPPLPEPGFLMQLGSLANTFRTWDGQVVCENQFIPGIRDALGTT